MAEVAAVVETVVNDVGIWKGRTMSVRHFGRAALCLTTLAAALAMPIGAYGALAGDGARAGVEGDAVLHLGFEGNAKDSSGRGNDGEIHGDPQFVKGVNGKAVRLVNDGDIAGSSSAAEQYIDFGKPADLQFGEGDFSIAFWTKTERPQGRKHEEGAIVSNKNWDTGGNEGFNIGDMAQGVNFNFNTDSSLSRCETARFAEAVDGNWHHIAATVDREGYMTLYIDGVQPVKGSGHGSGSARVNVADHKGVIDAFNFMIGADGRGRYGVLDVTLDELSVYRKELTEEQVGALYEQYRQDWDAPVLSVSFDEGAAVDESGHGNDGEVVGSPEFGDGVKGKAIHLVNPDGVAESSSKVAEQCVDFGSSDDLNFGEDDFSIMFWYKANGDDPEEVSVVSNKDWSTGGNVGFAIGDMRNGMTLNFKGEGGSRADTSRVTAATDGSWHHVMAVFDRSQDMTLYVDGVEAASKDISDQVGKSVDVANFVLGADGYRHFSVNDSWIDELVVYRRVLTEEEISDLNAPATAASTD